MYVVLHEKTALVIGHNAAWRSRDPRMAAQMSPFSRMELEFDPGGADHMMCVPGTHCPRRKHDRRARAGRASSLRSTHPGCTTRPKPLVQLAPYQRNTEGNDLVFAMGGGGPVRLSLPQDETLALAAHPGPGCHTCFVTAYQDLNFTNKCLNAPQRLQFLGGPRRGPCSSGH